MDRDFFDNAFDKAKNAFEVAYKKTGDVVNTEKLKFNVSSLKSQRDKLFIKLGKNFYEDISDSDIPEQYQDIVSEIKDMDEKIAELNNQINFAKNKKICPNCRQSVDTASVYCNYCGAKLVFDSAEDKDSEV